MADIQSIAAINNMYSAASMTQKVDGKIFVASDVFSQEKAAISNIPDLQSRLSEIDNLAKDKNGSQSLFYTNVDTSASEKQNKNPNKKEFPQGEKINFYA